MADFFKYPLNYGNNRSQHSETADNDDNTVSTEAYHTLYIDSVGDGTGTAQSFTHVFVKGKNLGTTYTIAPSGGSPTTTLTRTIPTTVTNDADETVNITKNQVTCDLYNLWTDESAAKPTAQTLILNFPNATRQLLQIMVLDKILTIDSDGTFSRIEYDSLQLGTLQEDIQKRLTYIPPINNERDKWLVNLTAMSRGDATLAEELIDFIRQHKNFTFAPEYTRYPDRVFPALWPQATTQIRYLSQSKTSGRQILFSVREA